MKIVFSCPECRSPAEIEMTGEEEAEIKTKITSTGRSPTIIVRCKQGHELLVTLYNTPNGLGIRDVVVPLRKEEESKPVSGLDWVSRAFGGE